MNKSAWLMLVVFCSMVFGQLPPPREPGRPDPGPVPNRGDETLEPRKWIERIRIVTLIDELDLTEEQIARFIPKFKDQQKLEREFVEKRMARLGELRQLVDSEKASEDKLKAKISEIEKLQGDFQNKQETMRHEMYTQLTTQQKAKMLLFHDEFEKKLRRIIDEARKRPGLRRGAEPDLK